MSDWNLSGLRPYLELYGETQPLLCDNLAETLSASSTNNDLQMEAGVPIYEYFWTLGISDHLHDLFSQHTNLKHHHSAAEVSLYFPLSGGWRVYEVVATIRYLRPLPYHKENLIGKVADYWKIVAPVVDSAAAVLKDLPPPLSFSSTILHLLAKLQITALPPVDGLAWSVNKVTGCMGTEVMDGVRWTIPKEMFQVLGSRLTGSIAVYFHPSQRVQDDAVSINQAVFKSKTILAEAVVHTPKGDQRIPATENKYIELYVTPSSNRRLD